MVLSVLVTTYNHNGYIRKCLDGILMQKTSFLFEIILGEDESDDGTREICKEYANKYPNKIKLFLRSREDVIYIKGNPTGRYNFIENLKACRGKYIALCEGDDYWTDPLKLQKQVDFLEVNTSVGVCFHKSEVLKEGTLSTHRISDDFIEAPFRYIELLKHYNFITTASVMFRVPKAFELPDWYKQIPFGDMALYKLVSKNKSFYCLKDSMAVYRIHDNGIYSGITRQMARRNYIDFFRLIYPFLSKKEKQVVRFKLKETRTQMAKVRFPNQVILQKLYYFYLRFNIGN